MCNVFVTRGMPVGFLTEDRDRWTSMDDFKAAEAIVRTPAVTKYPAERGATMIQDVRHREGALRVKNSCSYMCTFIPPCARNYARNLAQ